MRCGAGVQSISGAQVGDLIHQAHVWGTAEAEALQSRPKIRRRSRVAARGAEGEMRVLLFVAVSAPKA